jgi:hypothetical protein
MEIPKRLERTIIRAVFHKRESWEMSVAGADTRFKFRPFYAILQEGCDRMFDVVRSETFQFFVNGECYESTLAEAVLISPRVHDVLRNDRSSRAFVISDEDLESRDFGHFLDFVRCHDCVSFSEDKELSFLSICRLLGNERLALILLASQNSTSSSNHNSIFVLKSPSSVSSPSCETVSDDIVFGDIKVDYCASHFHTYSIDKLRRLDKHMLHDILSSPSLALESEDGLLRVLIELGSAYFEFWTYIEVVFLTDKGFSLFVDKLPFDELTKEIWSQVILRLRGASEGQYRRRNCRDFPVQFESAILSDFPAIFSELGQKQWTLLYRGTEDGFGSSDFHRKCDSHSNTITIILTTKGFIFGGFTPVVWDSSNAYKPDSTQTSFLFSLKNPHTSEAKKFPMKSSSNAIYCSSLCGPTFGSRCDMSVQDRCNESTDNYTALGGAYVNDTGIDGKQIFTGECNFTVKEIEVFYISL